jgi:hypothetical protein
MNEETMRTAKAQPRNNEYVNYLNYLNSLAGSSSSSSDVRVLKTVSTSKVLWDSARRFAFLSEMSMSALVERALCEYMMKHSVELPVSATFQLMPIPEKSKKSPTCGFRGCKEDAMGKAIYLPRNETFDLCDFHLKEAAADRKRWRLVPEDIPESIPNMLESTNVMLVQKVSDNKGRVEEQKIIHFRASYACGFPFRAADLTPRFRASDLIPQSLRENLKELEKMLQDPERMKRYEEFLKKEESECEKSK